MKKSIEIGVKRITKTRIEMTILCPFCNHTNRIYASLKPEGLWIEEPNICKHFIILEYNGILTGAWFSIE